MMSSVFLFALSLLAAGTFASVPGDLVTTLPGYNGKLPQRHYSGFIASDPAETVYLHYWFVESSAANPKTAPLLVWLNGGPGCSSLDGLLTELGPLHFSGKIIDGIPELIDNPYAWSTAANVLFIESPAGVGFSYNKNGSYITNDEITSQNNYGFLKNWLVAFSEYANNDLYISGESYAGIYVPTFGQRVWEGIKSGDANFNFKGILVGNGCEGNSIGVCGLLNNSFTGTDVEMTYLYQMNMISEPHWEDLNNYCGDYSNPSTKCIDAVTKATNDGGDYNIYNIYDTCPSPVSQTHRAQTVLTEHILPLKKPSASPKPQHRHRKRFQASHLETPDLCIGTWPVQYLNIANVQKALHVDQLNVTWAICSPILENDYYKTLPSAIPAYKGLIDNGYRVLIYSGDADACIPHVGSERWTSNLGYNEVSPWAPWLIDEQVAGYVTHYEKSFTYLTVKGAGHMVPQVMPVAALAMLTRYFNGSTF